MADLKVPKWALKSCLHCGGVNKFFDHAQHRFVNCERCEGTGIDPSMRLALAMVETSTAKYHCSIGDTDPHAMHDNGCEHDLAWDAAVEAYEKGESDG